MDTSKEYIKMCEKAGEIQKLWKKYHTDVYWFGGYKRFDGFIKGDEIRLIYEDTPCDWWKCIWLPRQDQLQELMFNQPQLDRHITQFYNFTQEKYTHQFTSMEQLWLAFVMKEKYGKTWDGEKWQK